MKGPDATKDSDRSEAIISVAIAIAVTVISVGQTIREWPKPMQLFKFRLEHHNRFGGY